MSLQSMTGYASAQSHIGSETPATPGVRLGLEIRSLNSRYLDVSFRLPDEFRQLEPRLRELINKHIKRGKVELRLNIETENNTGIGTPDTTLLKNLVNVQNQVRMWLPEAKVLSVSEVIRLSSQTHYATATNIAPQVMQLASEVVGQLCDARQREGMKLTDDLLIRVTQLHALAELALPLVPQAVALQKQKFLERWREALAMADTQALPESVHERALAEAASFAIRSDVAEEITRLTAHLHEITRLLTPQKYPEGVGKRLDFLIQELHREANTLSSKSSAIELTRISLDMKVLIEQMREQVQNLE
ncbi:MAG: YicC/YloC family endoribonuclease [Limnohabitans sp.]